MLNGKNNSAVYNLINKEKLDVVSKPIAESHGLPNECYISEEYTKIERKKLFEDKWVVEALQVHYQKLETQNLSLY